jgi:hypothetical protein
MQQEYVSKEEVKQVCKSLNIRDWTELHEPSIMNEESGIILKKLNVKGMTIEVEDFRAGLEVELEHGLRFDDANVTNNHPLLTGKIVIAHLKETLDYYRLLEEAELKGDLLKAIKSNDIKKIKDTYKKLIASQLVLNQSILNQL